MATILKDAQQRSAMAAGKEERARDAALAMREHEAEQVAVRAKTARLRALRLAKEAKDTAEAENAAEAKTTAGKKAVGKKAKKQAKAR